MFTSAKFAVGLVAVVAGVVSAAPNPTEPSSTSVFNVGATCSIQWVVDATATWKSMSIQLMSGDNFNMIPITTVAQNIDATDPTKTTFTYPCPQVTPTSAIYFYQFSSSTDPTNLLWTTRFTIAGPNGQTTAPAEKIQPDGQSIPWGTGALVNPSTAVAPPAYLSGSGQSTAAATGSASAGLASAGSVSSASASIVASASSTLSSGSSPLSSMTASAMNTMTSASHATSSTASGASSAPAPAASTSANAAPGRIMLDVMVVMGAVLAAAGII